MVAATAACWRSFLPESAFSCEASLVFVCSPYMVLFRSNLIPSSYFVNGKFRITSVQKRLIALSSQREKDKSAVRLDSGKAEFSAKIQIFTSAFCLP